MIARLRLLVAVWLVGVAYRLAPSYKTRDLQLRSRAITFRFQIGRGMVSYYTYLVQSLGGESILGIAEVFMPAWLRPAARPGAITERPNIRITNRPLTQAEFSQIERPPAVLGGGLPGPVRSSPSPAAPCADSAPRPGPVSNIPFTFRPARGAPFRWIDAGDL